MLVFYRNYDFISLFINTTYHTQPTATPPIFFLGFFFLSLQNPKKKKMIKRGCEKKRMGKRRKERERKEKGKKKKKGKRGFCS